jgi:hypothetical protein
VTTTICARSAPIVASVFALALGACSKSESMTPADAGGAGGGGASGMTCQQIRLCVLEGPCADDACVQACEQRGTPDAHTAFEALYACTLKACPTISDVNCACGEQCQAGGTCLHEADVCLGAVQVDDVCDSLCA